MYLYVALKSSLDAAVTVNLTEEDVKDSIERSGAAGILNSYSALFSTVLPPAVVALTKNWKTLVAP